MSTLLHACTGSTMRERRRGHPVRERDPLFEARLAVGALMLTSPRLASRLLGVEGAGRGSLLVLRVLGTRDLLQAAALRRARPAAFLMGAGVDACHGLTAAVFARSAPDRRRPGLRSAALAGAFCAAEVGVASRSRSQQRCPATGSQERESP
jgi:hypothetical protein